VRRATKLGGLYIHFGFFRAQNLSLSTFYFLFSIPSQSERANQPRPKAPILCILDPLNAISYSPPNQHHKVLNLSPFILLILSPNQNRKHGTGTIASAKKPTANSTIHIQASQTSSAPPAAKPQPRQSL
jgi:hypothetical protein